MPLVAIEYAAAILRADVWTNAVGLCRVVDLEEQLTQALVRNLLRIELYYYSLYMAGIMVAHIGIRGECLLASGVADKSVEHTILFLKLVLRALEASAGKYAYLDILVRRSMIQADL